MKTSKTLVSAAALVFAINGFASEALATTSKTITSTTTVSDSATQSKSKSTDFGSFGVGVTSSHSLTATPSSSSKSSSAGSSLDATIFGANLKVAEIDSGAAYATSGTWSFEIGAFGITLGSNPSQPIKSSKLKFEQCVEEEEPDAQLFVGPIPVVVETGVMPCAGISVYGTASSSVYSITLEPEATVTLDMSAGVGSSAFSVGIGLNLDFLSLGLPITQSIDVSGNKLTYGITGLLTETLLSGSISLYAKALFIKYTYTLLSFSGLKVASITLFTDSVPVASAVGADVDGTKASGSYSYSDSADLSDESTYQWYRASDASGTGETNINDSSQNHTLTTADDSKYLKFCVTPNNGTNAGTKVCSDYASVGHLASFYKDSNYGGSSINVAYETLTTGTCINLSSYSFNDKLTSYSIPTPSGYSATLILYKDSNCSGTSLTDTGAANSTMTQSNIKNVASSLNDEISSFRMVWNDSMTASDVAVVFSESAANGSYTLDSASNMQESGSTYTWSRASDSAGTGSTTVATGSTTYTLSDSDSDKYLRFCITPSDGIATGTKQCSSWTAVGRTLKLYKDSNYGGTSVTVPYQQYSSTTCFSLSDLSMNDALTSFSFKAMSSYKTALVLYKDSNCSGTHYYFSTSAGATYSQSTLSDYSFNDQATSFQMVWNDTVKASNVTTTISGNAAKLSYTFSSSAGLAEDDTTYTWYRASDSSGTGATTIGSSSTSYTLTEDDDNMYIKGCVTPHDMAFGGSRSCSSYMPVGRLVKLYKDSKYSGTSHFIAYERSSSGACFNMGTYSFNDDMTSYSVTAPSDKSIKISLYKDSNCSGGTLSYSVNSGATKSQSSMNDVSSSWNDELSSIKVTY